VKLITSLYSVLRIGELYLHSPYMFTGLYLFILAQAQFYLCLLRRFKSKVGGMNIHVESAPLWNSYHRRLIRQPPHIRLYSYTCSHMRSDIASNLAKSLAIPKWNHSQNSTGFRGRCHEQLTDKGVVQPLQRWPHISG
jgi:hypothetical protein